MQGFGLEIVQFDPHSATEEEFRRLNSYYNKVRTETWPDEPPLTLAQTIRDETERPEFLGVKEWTAVQPGSEIVARASIEIWHVGQNQHIGNFQLSVLPEMRRRGIATALLRRIALVAEEKGRSLLIAWTNSNVPAGGAFLTSLGAEMALSSYSNVLQIAELNRDLVRQWQERGDSLVGDFELGLWTGSYPEEELPAIARLQGVMNTAPRGTLQMEDWTTSVEELTEWELSRERRGIERWTMFVRDRKTGELAGYTEMHWDPEQPQVLHQGDTGVFPAYRSRGLATWIKAAMLEKVLRERPQVERITTGNAQSNAPMLSINNRLGFKPRMATFSWQVSLERVQQYLRTRPETL